MDRYCEGTKGKKHKKTLMVSPYGKDCTCSWVCPVCDTGFVLAPCHCPKSIIEEPERRHDEDKPLGKERDSRHISSPRH